MPNDTIPCLYCGSDNEETQSDCQNCGMALPERHPHSGSFRRKVFAKAFIGITLFCLIMMYFLPR